MVSVKELSVDKAAIWSMGADTIKALFPIYRLALQAVLRESGIEKEWIILFHARGSEPEPFSAARLLRLWPYTSEKTRTDSLQALLKKNYIALTGDDHYHLTAQGYRASDHIIRMVQRELGKSRLMNSADSKYLANLLWRLVQAVHHTHEPNDKRAFSCSRWTDLGVNAPPITRIDQYLTDLGRFRDDCHLSAWQQHHIEGYVWDALTCIWRGEAFTASALATTLAYRGISTETYATALNHLIEYGWVEADANPDLVRITHEGCIIRQQAEARTNTLFFTPWSALSNNEIADLNDLLTHLLATLKQTK